MAPRNTVSTRRTVSAEEKRYQAQSDLRTIQSATEIKADPKRLAAAQKEAAAQMKALGGVVSKKK